MQLQEAEQQYAEIYEEYEKGRVFFANIEAEMHKAQQVWGSWSWRRCGSLPLCWRRQLRSNGDHMLHVRAYASCCCVCMPLAVLFIPRRPPRLAAAGRAVCPLNNSAACHAPFPTQEYMKEQRQWKESSAAEAQRVADLEKQLGAERAGRDAAEAQLAVLKVCVWGGPCWGCGAGPAQCQCLCLLCRECCWCAS